MITKEQILHLANLARLKLSDEEIEKLVQDLTKILNYVEKINELDLKNIEPMINIIEKLEPREDDGGDETYGKDTSVSSHSSVSVSDYSDSFDRFASVSAPSNIINQFPQKENNYLKVPKILEK
ncbi:MAG: hypothetical protein KatS3mg096_004 [Candidatus Parcubacteria bacterium]|nr:MAG: hypothetical protein KatS3mg096_004 [Candidatus Parcubacteria bacterium]